VGFKLQVVQHAQKHGKRRDHKFDVNNQSIGEWCKEKRLEKAQKNK
jgi:hypothetical protein